MKEIDLKLGWVPILKHLRKGERVVVTDRQRPVAVVLPYESEWVEIETAHEASARRLAIERMLRR